VKSVLFSSSPDTDIGSHNYGVVIDAGSSGSKVQLFHWPPHNGDPTRLLKIEPLVDKMGDTLVTRVHPGVCVCVCVCVCAHMCMCGCVGV